MLLVLARIYNIMLNTSGESRLFSLILDGKLSSFSLLSMRLTVNFHKYPLSGKEFLLNSCIKFF